MRKVFLQAPPETGAITNYASEVSRLLRPAVSGEQANEIVGEAQAHLYDQAETIKVRENVSQNEAEARAVAAFTPPGAFAREMARSAMETRYSKAWHETGKVLTVFLLCVVSALFLTDGVFFVPLSPLYIWLLFNDTLYLLLCLTMGVCLCAFLARRAQTRFLLCSLALVATLLFVHNGFFYIMSSPIAGADAYPVSRLRTQERNAKYPKQSVQISDDIRRLNAGLQTYGPKNLTVPTSLRGLEGHGYLVPYAVTSNMVLAKANPNNTHYYNPFSTPLSPQTLSETVESVSEARARWLKDGPAYLAQARIEKERALRGEATMQAALRQTGFSPSAGWWFVAEADTVRSGLLLLFLDWLFAKLGRAMYIKRRARRERKMAQA